METEKKIYTSPQVKKIYAAPLLIKHGMVAQLTGSLLNQDFYNGHNNNRPPAQSSPAVLPGAQHQPPKEEQRPSGQQQPPKEEQRPSGQQQPPKEEQRPSGQQ